MLRLPPRKRRKLVAGVRCNDDGGGDEKKEGPVFLCTTLCGSTVLPKHAEHAIAHGSLGATPIMTTSAARSCDRSLYHAAAASKLTLPLSHCFRTQSAEKTAILLETPFVSEWCEPTIEALRSLDGDAGDGPYVSVMIEDTRTGRMWTPTVHTVRASAREAAVTAALQEYAFTPRGVSILVAWLSDAIGGKHMTVRRNPATRAQGVVDADHDTDWADALRSALAGSCIVPRVLSLGDPPGEEAKSAMIGAFARRPGSPDCVAHVRFLPALVTETQNTTPCDCEGGGGGDWEAYRLLGGPTDDENNNDTIYRQLLHHAVTSGPCAAIHTERSLTFAWSLVLSLSYIDISDVAGDLVTGSVYMRQIQKLPRSPKAPGVYAIPWDAHPSDTQIGLGAIAGIVGVIRYLSAAGFYRSPLFHPAHGTATHSPAAALWEAMLGTGAPQRPSREALVQYTALVLAAASCNTPPPLSGDLTTEEGRRAAALAIVAAAAAEKDASTSCEEDSSSTSSFRAQSIPSSSSSSCSSVGEPSAKATFADSLVSVIIMGFATLHQRYPYASSSRRVDIIRYLRNAAVVCSSETSAAGETAAEYNLSRIVDPAAARSFLVYAHVEALVPMLDEASCVATTLAFSVESVLIKTALARVLSTPERAQRPGDTACTICTDTLLFPTVTRNTIVALPMCMPTRHSVLGDGEIVRDGEVARMIRDLADASAPLGIANLAIDFCASWCGMNET